MVFRANEKENVSEHSSTFPFLWRLVDSPEAHGKPMTPPCITTRSRRDRLKYWIWIPTCLKSFCSPTNALDPKLCFQVNFHHMSWRIMSFTDHFYRNDGVFVRNKMFTWNVSRWSLKVEGLSCFFRSKNSPTWGLRIDDTQFSRKR